MVASHFQPLQNCTLVQHFSQLAAHNQLSATAGECILVGSGNLCAVLRRIYSIHISAYWWNKVSLVWKTHSNGLYSLPFFLLPNPHYTVSGQVTLLFYKTSSPIIWGFFPTGEDLPSWSIYYSNIYFPLLFIYLLYTPDMEFPSVVAGSLSALCHLIELGGARCRSVHRTFTTH